MVLPFIDSNVQNNRALFKQKARGKIFSLFLCNKYSISITQITLAKTCYFSYDYVYKHNFVKSKKGMYFYEILEKIFYIPIDTMYYGDEYSKCHCND